MNPALPLINSGTAPTETVHAIKPTGGVAASDHEVTGADVFDDTNFSAAGEEDPGAALDPSDPPPHPPAAWCPWPREHAS